MSFADTLSDGQRKHYRRVAVISAICGGFSTQIIENNAPVVLYLAMLGANDSLSMFSTSLSGLATLLLLIPSASFCAWLGLRKTYTLSSALGFLSFMLITFAPFFGKIARRSDFSENALLFFVLHAIIVYEKHSSPQGREKIIRKGEAL